MKKTHHHNLAGKSSSQISILKSTSVYSNTLLVVKMLHHIFGAAAAVAAASYPRFTGVTVSPVLHARKTLRPLTVYSGGCMGGCQRAFLYLFHE